MRDNLSLSPAVRWMWLASLGCFCIPPLVSERAPLLISKVLFGIYKSFVQLLCCSLWAENGGHSLRFSRGISFAASWLAEAVRETGSPKSSVEISFVLNHFCDRFRDDLFLWFVSYWIIFVIRFVLNYLRALFRIELFLCFVSYWIIFVLCFVLNYFCASFRIELFLWFVSYWLFFNSALR